MTTKQSVIERLALLAAKYIRCYINRTNPLRGIDEARDDFAEVEALSDCKTGLDLTYGPQPAGDIANVGGGSSAGGDAALSRSPLSSPTPSNDLAAFLRAAHPQNPLVDLLRECRKTLEEGLETPGEHEPEWSISERALIARIDAALPAPLTKVSGN